MHDDEIDLREVFRSLWRARWRILSVAVLAALGAAFLSSFVLPQTYEARAVLMVTSSQVQTVDPDNPSLRVGGDLNVVAVLKPEMSAEALAALARSVAVATEVAHRAGVSVRWLEKRMHASVLRGTNLVELRVRAFDPKTAKEIAVVWSHVLLERSRQAFATQAEEAYRSFAGRLREAQAAVERGDVELKEFQSRSRIGELQARLAKLTDQLATYEVRANDLDVALVRAEAEFEQLKEEVRRQPPKLVLERALATDPFMLQVAAESNRAGVRETAGLTLRVEEQNPVYNSVRDRSHVASVAVTSLRAEKARVEFQIRRLREEIAGLRSQLAQEQLEETRLRRRVDATRRVYDALLQRREEARIAALSGLGSVELVAPAVARERPVSPHPALNTALAGTLGFLVAVFWVLVRDQWAASAEPSAVRSPASDQAG